MITIRDIGVAFDAPPGRHRLAGLEAALDEFQRAGFRLVELSPSWFGAIINGELREPQASRLIGVLTNFNLRYSVHGLERLNLAFDPRRQLTQNILLAQIEFCHRIGASALVYHSGLQALDELRRGTRASLLSDAELAEGALREVAALKEAAPVAAEAGVTIAVENGDVHLWEYALLARHGLPREALPKYQGWVQISSVVRQLEAVNHPAVGLTLDIAHLHISAHEVGFDYLAAVSEAAPWVRHMHANDNFGRLDRGDDLDTDRWAYGEADIHMPPGWGSLPYREVLARLPDYAGDLILEIKPGFFDYLPEALSNMRGMVY